MESEKTESRFIYIHELAIAIAKSVLTRAHISRFPNGVYKKDSDGLPLLDEEHSPVYTDKALCLMLTDYHYFRDVIEKHIINEEQVCTKNSIMEKDKDTVSFLHKIRGFFT